MKQWYIHTKHVYHLFVMYIGSVTFHLHQPTAYMASQNVRDRAPDEYVSVSRDKLATFLFASMSYLKSTILAIYLVGLMQSAGWIDVKACV